MWLGRLLEVSGRLHRDGPLIIITSMPPTTSLPARALRRGHGPLGLNRRSRVSAHRWVAGVRVALAVIVASVVTLMAIATPSRASSGIFTSTSEIAAGIGSTSVYDGLFSVSCTSANNCVAVGSEGSGSAQKAIYVNDTAGTWATDGASLTLPSDANSNAYPRLNGVSCPQSGDCVTVGTYQSSSGLRAMAVSQSSGTWPAAVSVTPPSNTIPLR